MEIYDSENNILAGRFWVTLIIVLIFSVGFAAWINLSEFQILPLFLYATIIISADYIILFLVNKWKKRPAYSIKSSI